MPGPGNGLRFTDVDSTLSTKSSPAEKRPTDTESKDPIHCSVKDGVLTLAVTYFSEKSELAKKKKSNKILKLALHGGV